MNETVTDQRFEAAKKLGLYSRGVLLFLSFILGWKLFRLAFPYETTWNLHNYIIILSALFSIGLSIKNNLYIDQSHAALTILLFIILSVLRLGFFPHPDPFFMASLVFCLYYLMLTIFLSLSLDYGFKFFEGLLKLMLIYNAIDYVDANSDVINIFSYEIPSFMSGTMNPMGHMSQSFFSGSLRDGFIIRSVGVSGTNYASSALTAATAVYFLIVQQRRLFFLSGILLLFWGVGSSILAALGYILWIKRKSKVSIIFFVLGLALAAVVITSRGWSSSVYLNLINNFGALDFAVASVIGEGRAVSSIHTEFRIIGLFYSLGFLGTFLLTTIILSYRAVLRLPDNKRFREFSGGLGFIVVLLIATGHYNSFFVFPNIFFVVMLCSFASVSFMRAQRDATGSARY